MFHSPLDRSRAFVVLADALCQDRDLEPRDVIRRHALAQLLAMHRDQAPWTRASILAAADALRAHVDCEVGQHGFALFDFRSLARATDDPDVATLILRLLGAEPASFGRWTDREAHHHDDDSVAITIPPELFRDHLLDCAEEIGVAAGLEIGEETD